MAPASKPLVLVTEETTIDCPVVLSVRCLRQGKVYEFYEAYSRDAVSGLSLSTVGTHLQRMAYEGLRQTYSDALNERNAIGEVDEEKG